MPAGLPDWTLPVGIVAQMIDKLAVDIIAQSVGNVKVDLAAQSLANLNVYVTNAEIPIRIRATDVTLPVSIESSTVTLDVNISAQTIDVAVNITAQQVGLKDESIWASEQGYSKTLLASVTVQVGVCQYAIWYNVPAGKKLYVRKVYVSPHEPGIRFYTDVEDYTAANVYALKADTVGVEFSFDPPIVIPGGNTFAVMICHYESTNQPFNASALGWEK